jgi:hypothetical protein
MKSSARDHDVADIRFVILSFPPSLDPAALGFPPSGDEPEDADVDGWSYAWRLVAGNNRRLGHSVHSQISRTGVVDAIARVRAGLDQLVPRVLAEESTGLWTWCAELDGVPVATCSHDYERERDGYAGFDKFRDAVGRAQLAEGALILRDLRSRDLRGSVSVGVGAGESKR